MTTDKTPEIVDLVDANDNVIGQIERDNSINNLEVHGGYIGVVDCFLMNSQGELWVPRRTADKDIAPNGLDFSVGEHMQAGEVYEDAIIRGFEEELGFQPDPEKLEFLGVRKPEGKDDIFQGIFAYHTDEEPDYNRNDFTGAEWIKPEDLISRIKNGENAKSNIVPTLKAYFM